MKNWLLGLVISVVVVACGGVDPQSLDGGWQLNRTDAGLGMHAKQLYFLNGRVTPRGETIGQCNMQYQIEGDKLTIFADPISGCNMSGIQLMIEAVNQTELILSLNGKRMYYNRIANRPY